MGLFAGQKWCISGNPGNTLLGHHLSVGIPSVCSQGKPCQILWSGMLGLDRGGQRQLRFSKFMSQISPSEHILIQQTMPDELFNKTQISTSRHKLSIQGSNKIHLAKGPGYLNVLFGFGARTLTGMAGLTLSQSPLLLVTPLSVSSPFFSPLSISHTPWR